ncbi:MAG: 16S rRNA (adenine(1518)-N(6)/adenine(1519)-N(6))-dimethyltransferase RsmA [Firmicutes bacterium]|nr:16S rRNA (adenine(1518)-N(6)/adenine(1519)-N(6))-dimethyltransferase RsmA [Bacillota bacterium]
MAIDNAKHKFKKSLGQNFLRDEGFLESIVKSLGLSKSDTVIEVGAGEGILTRALNRHAGQVVSFEVDRSLEPKLQGLNVRFEDALYADIDVGEYKVVANVPYYITTPLLFKFIKDENCTEISVLVQREVADRIIARVGTKEYGALSVAVQAWGTVKKVRDVPRYMFTPQPNVDSSFIQIVRASRQVISPMLLKGLFSYRRKTVENGLMKLYGRSRDEVGVVLDNLGINRKLRPENLGVEEYLRLSEAILRAWMHKEE